VSDYKLSTKDSAAQSLFVCLLIGWFIKLDGWLVSAGFKTFSITNRYLCNM